ncbi:MAG: hypothetical protein ACRC6V_13400 [Bacteroidales bacterium]
MFNTVFFRDKTASLDILHAMETKYWDNTVKAHKLTEQSIVIITPMKSNYRTKEEWLNAPALLATHNGKYEKLNTDTGEWPSNDEGGYLHRYHFNYVSNNFRVRDLIDSNLDIVESMRQGSVFYK